MTYLLTIDPGESTGITLGTYSDTEAYQRIMAWQFTGGLEGFEEWYTTHRVEASTDSVFELTHCGGWEFENLEVLESNLEIVSEKFTLLSHEYVANIEPVRIEGAMQHAGMMPLDRSEKVWQDPALMYFAGGDDLPSRKKAAQLWLKDADHWLTGTDVGQPDANDANSATLHAFARMKAIQHIPTLNRYFRKRVIGPDGELL